MKRLIGILLIMFAFMVMFIPACIVIGIKATLCIWGIAICVAACLILGIWLIG